MSALVEERASLRRNHVRGRRVFGLHRAPSPGIAPERPPDDPTPDQGACREPERPVVGHEPPGPPELRGMRHVARRPADQHCHPLARPQRARRPEPPVALDAIHRVVAPDRAEAAGVGGGSHVGVADACRQGHVDLGSPDRHVPLGAGSVPVDLVEILVEAELAGGAIAERVDVLAMLEQGVGAADADSHAVLDAFPLPRQPSSGLAGILAVSRESPRPRRSQLLFRTHPSPGTGARARPSLYRRLPAAIR